MATTRVLTNYNHMHALNMEYYEVLHRYDTVTELNDVTPILYLPFGALPLHHESLVDEFWDSIRTGMPDDLRQKGDTVFVDPPPPEFVPETVPPTPDPPAAISITGLRIDVEISWDLELADLLMYLFGGVVAVFADQIFTNASVELELNNSTYVASAPPTRIDDVASATTTFEAFFPGSFSASDITGVRVVYNSPTDIFDNASYVRVLVGTGTALPPEALTLAGLLISSGNMEYDETGAQTEAQPR